MKVDGRESALLKGGTPKDGRAIIFQKIQLRELKHKGLLQGEKGMQCDNGEKGCMLRES